MQGMSDLLDAAVEIYGSEPENLKYLHVVLAQCGLPYKQQGTGDYMRQNGKATMILTPGYLIDPSSRAPVKQGLPYGAKPRLLMMNFCTQAKLQKSPTIDIGRSMSEFMRDLGLSVTGGKNGTIGGFKDQLNRLAATRMQLLYQDDEKATMVDATTVKKFEVWFPKKENEKALWPNTVTLSPEFFESLMAQMAMPLDGRAIRGLQQSAMSLDVYTWLAHRLCRIKGFQPVSISWMALQNQFGQDFVDRYAFRQTFKIALGKVLTVYRDANVSFNRAGIIQLRQSKPPVPKATLAGKIHKRVEK